MNYQFDFESVLSYWPMFLEGAGTTLQMSFWATLVGFVLGVLCAVARSSGPVWLRKLVGGSVELIRNTQLLVASYFLIFGMSSIGLRMPIMVGAILALVMYIVDTICDIYRMSYEWVQSVSVVIYRGVRVVYEKKK